MGTFDFSTNLATPQFLNKKPGKNKNIDIFEVNIYARRDKQ